MDLEHWRNHSHPQKLPELSDQPKIISYFSAHQRQELELQAFAYRYIVAGIPVPHEVLLSLHRLSSSQGFLPHHLQRFSLYNPNLIQPGYWGRAAFDPEPGRCRRTDGKKWRCSRDVVPGRKYCERHVHRGRNRSRKPVETSDSTSETVAVPASRPSPFKDSLQRVECGPGPAGRVLRSFFDDSSAHKRGSVGESSVTTDCSMSGSDVALKLATGSVSKHCSSCWASGPHQPDSVGGPLAEALRSNNTTSQSPSSGLVNLSPASGSQATSVCSS